MNWAAADRAVADAVIARHAERGRPIVIGLSGSQGSGKSTMAPRIAALLAKRGLSTAILALDDFYLTWAERQSLARTVHPFLATRGVPGTHAVPLLADAIDALLSGRPATIPRFDKAADDRSGSHELAGPFEVVLLEGWCVGARPQSAADLALPINTLERDEDPAGPWRGWVNEQLAITYAALFARLDMRVFLRAPDFDVVARWRGEQEAALSAAAMSPAQLVRFIEHYERLTRWMLVDEPADLVIDLDPRRVPLGVRRKYGQSPPM